MPSPVRSRRIFTLLFLLCSKILFAQKLPFYNLSIEQGLIQSQASCLEQDDIGHLWIGTLGGLSRWDGHQFVNYTLRDGLPSNTILSLCKGGRDSMWIGTAKGLSLYNGHTFRNFTFSSPDNPQGNIVAAIAKRHTEIRCIAGTLLYSVRAGKVSAMPPPEPDARCTALFCDSKGRLWLGTEGSGKIYALSEGGWDALKLWDGAKTAFRFSEESNIRCGHILSVITEAGLLQYGCYDARMSGGSFRHPEPGTARILQIAQTGDPDYWAAASSGAYRFKEGRFIHYGRREGFTDNRINAVLKDREGNLWFATDGQGVYRYSGTPFTILDESSGLGTGQVTAFAQDKHGALYMGTYEAGIYRFAGGRVSSMQTLRGLPVGIMATALGKVWAGTRGGGLYYLDGTSWRPFTRLPFKTIGALYTTPDGRLWIGGGPAAAVLSKDSLHLISGAAAVRDFLALGADSMLIAGSKGLQLYTGGTVYPFITGGLADSATIQCTARSGNTIFFGTSDNGVVIYNSISHKSISIGREEGLRSDFIYNLALDADSNLWAGTGFGIHRIHFPKSGYSITFYGQEAGLKGMESNHNAVLEEDNGSIWFGTTGGAVHYVPEPKEQASAPAVIISSLLLFGKAIADTGYFRGRSPYYSIPDSLRLPYRYNNLTFSFNGILLSGGPLQYRYLLEGLDAQWSAWSSNNIVNYSAIPSGKYALRVQCRSSDGATGSAVPYRFEIITPFHKTGLFRLLVLIACILLGITLQYYAARRRIARERLIEKLRREEQAIIRQRTAEDFHDEVGNKITRINVLASVLKSKLGVPQPEALRIINSIQEAAGQLYQGTRDILWSLKPSNDSLYENINRIIHFGQDLFGDTDVKFSANGLDESWKTLRLPMDASRNLIMIFKEALNNVLKHSGATIVSLKAALDKDLLILELRDNGKGFNPEEIARGHGLDNMQNRAARIAGNLEVQSSPSNGTTFTLHAKIPLTKG